MRHIITLLLMLPLLADAQIYIDSYRFGIPPVPGLLLDSFPGAHSAYSFRKLDNDYTGNCIVVQRDNGDTSAIGFAGNFLDTAAMKTFCGEGANDSCRVRLWYDQSGNNRYVRSTTASIMPLIMKDGIVVRIGGRVAMDFDNAQYLTAQLNTDWNFVHQTGDYFNFGVTKAYNISNPTVGSGVIWGNRRAGSVLGGLIVVNNTSPAVERFQHSAHTDGGVACFSNVQDNLGPSNVVFLHTVGGSPNNATAANRSKLSVNGSAFAQNNTTTTAASTNNATYPMSFGAARDASGVYGLFFTGQIFEQIFYASDKTSDRAAIETNINTFYSIY
jgi:hypothetical protein